MTVTILETADSRWVEIKIDGRILKYSEQAVTDFAVKTMLEYNADGVTVLPT